MGGHLASVTSMEETDFLKILVRSVQLLLIVEYNMHGGRMGEHGGRMGVNGSRQMRKYAKNNYQIHESGSAVKIFDLRVLKN
jgi:hypothetical protein